MGNLDSLDSPRLGLGGSHHLLPYIILYIAPRHAHPNGFYSRDSQGGVPGNCPDLDSQDFGSSQLPAQTLDWNKVWSKLVALLKSFPTVCCTPFSHTGVESIPDFLWSGVKLPVWLPALLSTITCAADVWMVHARSFSTSTIQGLSNGIKNTSRQGVLTSAIELWSCKSPGGLQVPTFGSVSPILTLASKWGCDTLEHFLFPLCSHCCWTLFMIHLWRCHACLLKPTLMTFLLPLLLFAMLQGGFAPIYSLFLCGVKISSYVNIEGFVVLQSQCPSCNVNPCFKKVIC
jgi:hypothetical protein